MTGKNEPDIQAFMAKVKAMEKGEKLDLSSDEDLSIGIMNLISIEEHLFFTYKKTSNEMYLTILNEVREMRKELLKRIIKEYEGEVWCISKHLLAASMRMMEVGTKALTKGDTQDAQGFFDKSYQLYSLFWGLNLGMVDGKQARQVAAADIKAEETKQASIFDKMGALVKQAVDCCKE